ncbi:M64 family metallopeptidase [Carboxylicivirga sp. N1Y90]|uniref:M64 family metallopeptidase n=1 Tax=Carboxylicivirga fragile TaxID=3417571 RepID=UPI003D35102B|nr:peptidase M64 [Marinilabiliaceae bacterium N1Y90]
MKFLIVNITIFFLISSCLNAQMPFDKHFVDKSMRVDLILAGDALAQSAYIIDIKKEPHWGGSHTALIDTFNYGEYRFLIINKNSGDTLYTRGFCTLFEEWRTTEEANSSKRAFYHSVTFPYPKANISFVLQSREKDGSFIELYSSLINPKNANIKVVKDSPYEVIPVINNGDSEHMLDLTFIAEGYRKDEMKKFKANVEQQARYLLSQSPFKEAKDKINVWAICSPSIDNGPSEPEKKNWSQTAVSSAFNTFYVDRYLETYDVKSIRDIACAAPYDHIVVLVNSDRYGGGGIYNHFSIGTSDHALSKKVLIHEIGHGLFGLADEYYTSDVAYQDFFNLKIEPWQPNVTTLVDFESKWLKLLPQDYPIPTPTDNKYKDTTGVFEGGGYVAKGVYRPAYNCRMKSNEAKGFCEVCEQSGLKMINFLTK